MSDVYSKEKRSEIMSAVRSRGNKSTELRVLALLKENHITGWRRGYRARGHPDFVFLDQKVAIFVDGCFWHGHECRRTPRSSTDYWNKKIDSNVRHDVEITALFENRGWTVLRIWECDVRKSPGKCAHIVLDSLRPDLRCSSGH